MKIIWFTLILFFPLLVQAQIKKDLSRLNKVPDIMQTDNFGDLPDGGKYYCAAVSAANYLVWLSDKGYPNLLQGGSFDKEKVLNLAKVLGSSEYMSITKLGITSRQFSKAVTKYVNNCGYKIEPTKVWGFNDYNHNPNFDEIISGLNNKGVVWLMLGKFKYDKELDEYTSKAFHYVSLIGYDKTNNSLIINCSSPKSGSEYLNEFVLVEKIDSGNVNFFVPKLLDIKTSANGFYMVKDGLKWKNDNENVLIVGLVSLELE